MTVGKSWVATAKRGRTGRQRPERLDSPGHQGIDERRQHVPLAGHRKASPIGQSEVETRRRGGRIGGTGLCRIVGLRERFHKRSEFGRCPDRVQILIVEQVLSILRLGEKTGLGGAFE